MAHRLNVIIWADPWNDGGAIVRQVWTGGSTDDGYWPDDKQVTAEQADRDVGYYGRDSRVAFQDRRPEPFPFKRLGG